MSIFRLPNYGDYIELRETEYSVTNRRMRELVNLFVLKYLVNYATIYPQLLESRNHIFVSRRTLLWSLALLKRKRGRVALNLRYSAAVDIVIVIVDYAKRWNAIRCGEATVYRKTFERITCSQVSFGHDPPSGVHGIKVIQDDSTRAAIICQVYVYTWTSTKD